MKKNRKTINLYEKSAKYRFRVAQFSRFFAVFSLVMLLALGASAQNKRFSKKWEKQPLQTVIKALERVDVYKFNYQPEKVAKIIITADIQNKTVVEALDIILKNSSLEYSVRNQFITIRPKKQIVSNNITLSGRVYDANRKPIVGASVIIDGTTYGTATDKNGVFNISSKYADPTLLISSIGYKTKTIDWSVKSNNVTVTLQEDVEKVEEVQIIAYGERNKKDVVSSISSVKASDLKERPAANVMSLLQGKVAGLEITNQSGAPGGGGQVIAIRGYTALQGRNGDIGHDGSPLYVIDGVIINSDVSESTGISPLAELDPNIIESVEVLKDAASAALYGSRAGNGVILITTKKGKKGDAKFAVNASYSTSHLPVSYTQTGGSMERWFTHESMKNYRLGAYDRTDNVINNLRYPKSYVENYNGGQAMGGYDAWWNGGNGADLASVQDSLNPFYNNSTNWFKKAFRQGKVFNANVSAQGGTEKVQYMTALGYYTESGIMQGSDFARANMVSNILAKPVKRLSVETGISLSYSSRNSGGQKYSSKIDGMTLSPLSSSSLLAADGAVEDKFVKSINSVVSKQDNYNGRANMKLTYEFIKGLTLSTMGAIELSQANSNIFTPSYMDPRYNENKSYGKIDRIINFNNDNILMYRTTIARDHNLEALAGLTLTKRQFHQITGFATAGSSDRIYYVDQAWPSLINRGNGRFESLKQYASDFSENSMVSYLGRLAYNYKHKYLIEATVRQDGSSKFGENCKYATFPSVAIGWNIKDEAFMESLWWIDMAKFRASWGKSGQVIPQDYLAHGIISKGNIWNGQQGMKPNGIINKDLTWEKSDQYNVGLDLSFLNYRINAKIDYYQKYTSALLYQIPLYGGYYYDQNQYQNAMEVSNEGFELEADFDIFRNTPVKWRMRFNIARNWNKFEKSYSGNDVNGLVIGRSLYQINVLEDNGYWDYDSEVPNYYTMAGFRNPLQGSTSEYFVAGTRRITDQNGDGSINSDDYVYAGPTMPKAYGGWTNDLSWKSFSLYMHFSYAIGRKVIPYYNYSSMNGAGKMSAPIFTDLTKKTFWQKPGDKSDLPIMAPFGNLNSYTPTYMSAVEDVNFIRLQQLTVGYTFPQTWMKKIGLSGGRLFITGENVFIISNYTNYDPEVSDIKSGIDGGNVYPMSRKWVFGATINF